MIESLNLILKMYEKGHRIQRAEDPRVRKKGAALKMMRTVKVRGIKRDKVVDQIESSLPKEVDLETKEEMSINITEKIITTESIVAEIDILKSLRDNHHPTENIQETHPIQIEGLHRIEGARQEIDIIVIGQEITKDAAGMTITHPKEETDLCQEELQQFPSKLRIMVSSFKNIIPINQ